MACLVCLKPTANTNLCKACRGVISDAWFVGNRTGILQRLIGNYKFQRMLATSRDLAELLNEIIPVLDKNTIIVPIPTTPSRIRERGYDHMLLVAKTLARMRGYECQSILRRESDTKQRQASRKITYSKNRFNSSPI